MKRGVEWLKAAEMDLETAKILYSSDHLYPILACHCQQVIEKSFKAIFDYKNKPIPKIHKLQFLKDNLDDTFETDDIIIQMLDELYIEARYPGEFGLLPSGEPSLNQVKSFLKTASDVLEFTRILIENQ